MMNPERCNAHILVLEKYGERCEQWFSRFCGLWALADDLWAATTSIICTRVGLWKSEFTQWHGPVMKLGWGRFVWCSVIRRGEQRLDSPSRRCILSAWGNGGEVQTSEASGVHITCILAQWSQHVCILPHAERNEHLSFLEEVSGVCRDF